MIFMGIQLYLEKTESKVLKSLVELGPIDEPNINVLALNSGCGLIQTINAVEKLKTMGFAKKVLIYTCATKKGERIYPQLATYA